VWIYTSMYQHVVDQIDAEVRERYPELDPHWYQAGSEKVAQRAEAEWAAGGTKACLLMTSDVFWYGELAEQDRLAPYLAPTVLQIDRSLVDPDGYWATSRLSLMVMGINAQRVDTPPATMLELTEPGWRDRISMGDPLSSGTMFTTLAFLEREAGWAWFESMRENGLIAAGGNSSVLARVETGEREVGILLLENLLAARASNSPATPVYPRDGAIPIPGPIALTTDCANPRGAKAIYDHILSEAGQRAIVAGNMYAALPTVPAPDGAKPLSELSLRSWEPGFNQDVVARKAQLKERWSALITGD
jgi:iron(III) transport system substrate-binding protein